MLRVPEVVTRKANKKEKKKKKKKKKKKRVLSNRFP